METPGASDLVPATTASEAARAEIHAGPVERRLGASVFLGEGVELLEMIGVEHGLAEVGDRPHEGAGIRILGRALLLAEADRPNGLATLPCMQHDSDT